MPTDEELSEERRRCLETILGSSARKKLIVAGPGTGKTFTFKNVLEQTAGAKLALTFINALAAELRESLGDLAQTYTFHGYCKRLLYEAPTVGLAPGVHYYPLLIVLQVDDLNRLSDGPVSAHDIEQRFHYLDERDGLVAGALRSGAYYNAVGHLDSVYRVLRHFEVTGSVPTYQQVVVDEYQDFSL